jgi:hypothetical protein
MMFDCVVLYAYYKAEDHEGVGAGVGVGLSESLSLNPSLSNMVIQMD